MTDEQVVQFVNGCQLALLMIASLYHEASSSNNSADYPAYELYSDTLRAGIFYGEKGKQLRFVLGRDRKVKQIEKI